MMNAMAVIGMACLFPESADKEAFWQNLLAGRDLIHPGDAIDWSIDPRRIFDPRKGVADRIYSLEGGWIREFHFDPTGYALPEAWLAGLDRMFQWPLFVAREALQDAGLPDNGPYPANCGVVIGTYAWVVSHTSEQLIQPLYDAALEPALREALGCPDFTISPTVRHYPDEYNLQSGYVASLVAQGLALKGPAYTIDAACASSLYCFKLAALHLNRGEADLMLAGAVSGSHPVFTAQGFSTLQALPEGGRSRPLDAGSNGLAQSNGACMFLLKRHVDAVRDGDRIIATIRGVGLSNDGHGKHLITPSQSGQQLALQRAYEEAGVSPSAVDYIECHATGTVLGDRTELATIEAFFGGQPPLIGTVKSNVGHLLTAAGGAGVIKVALAMETGILPATIGVTNPLASPEGRLSPARLVLTQREWPSGLGRRMAAINSFGFGGTNAHMILEQGAGKEMPTPEPIAPQRSELAIIGMDAHFGGFCGLDEFARNLYAGHSAFRNLPESRWYSIDRHHDLLHQYGLTDNAPPPGAYIQEFTVDALRLAIPVAAPVCPR